MATGGDDVLDGELLRTVVRVASLAALHVVQEEEKTRTARTMAQWAVVLGAFDDDEDTENEDDVAPGEKRSRRVRERKDWRTSGWWIQLQDTDLLDYTTDAAKVFRGRSRSSPLLCRAGQAGEGEEVVLSGASGCRWSRRNTSGTQGACAYV